MKSKRLSKSAESTRVASQYARKDRGPAALILAGYGLAIGLALIWCPTTLGQFPPRPPGDHPRAGGSWGEPAHIDATGFLQGIAPGVMRIVTVDGQTWILQIAPGAKVKLEGPASKDFIRVGELVRFVARVNLRQGAVEEPVQSIFLFSVNYSDAETQLGVFPETGVSPAGGPEHGLDGMGEQPPGRHAPGRAGGRSRDTRPPGAGRAEQPTVQSMMLDVRGRVTDLTREGKLSVAVPPNIYIRGPLEVQLAENVEVRVNFSDQRAFLLAGEGDRIRAQGIQVGPNVARVTEVRIEKTTPLELKTPPQSDRKREPRERSRSSPSEVPRSPNAGTARPDPEQTEKPSAKHEGDIKVESFNIEEGTNP